MLKIDDIGSVSSLEPGKFYLGYRKGIPDKILIFWKFNNDYIVVLEQKSMCMLSLESGDENIIVKRMLEKGDTFEYVVE